ncbi:MAG TPA: toll/interleukin-1 receptor domain-containing protein [Geminicoccaceae bacterium]|nr:toll/interleukin-1 receptor domain-containing protein [Geminicoccaceae bacterium]
MAKNQPDYLVFISHSSKDRWIARQMAAIIERRAKRYGVRTFLDEVDLEGGDRIPATIKANLHACEEFVILLSPQSVMRQWVLVELGGAWTLDKRVMAITYNLATEKIPDIIDHDKGYDLNEFDRYVTELISRVKRKRPKR